MPFIKPVLRTSPLLLLFLLAACGGGSGGGGNEPTNRAPSADAGADQVVDAGTGVDLGGSGTDSDGSIAGYAWTQTGGADVTLDGADSKTPSFTAPEVGAAETLTFELTVTDNDGKTATDTVDVTVAPVIAVSGIVYDGPIANAVVTVTVGDKTYTATANADGSYSVNIGAVDPEAFITIHATGAAGQENVELVSIAGSFGALQSAAGDDGVLEAEESGNVNVTNLSTAKAVLMIQANGGEDISDDESLAVAEANVSGDDLMYLATVIKLVIDGGYDLPEGADSTLDLAGDRELANAFVETVDAADPEAFGKIYDEIISDPALMTSYTADNVPSEMFTLYVSSVEDASGTYRAINRGKTWTFGAGNRGTYSDADYASMGFDWAISGGKIAVTYDEPLFSNGYCTHPDTPPELVEGYTWYCEGETESVTLTLVHDGAVADTVLLSETGITNYPNTDGDPNYPVEGLDPVPSTGGLTNLAFTPAAVFAFDPEEVPGRWITAATGLMPAEVAALATGLIDSGFMAFKADGTGQRMATDHAPSEAFTWQVINGVLEVEYASGAIVHYYRLRRDGDVYDTLATVYVDEDKRHSEAGLMLEVEVDRLPLLEQDDIPGRYALFEMENDFSIRFDATNKGSEEYYDAEGPYDAYPFAWTLREDYVIEMAYYWDNVLGDNAECADAASCELYKHRLWYPAAYDDETGRVYLLEIQQRYHWDPEAAYHMGALRYYQPSVRYWGRTELAAPAGMAKPSTATASGSSKNRMSSVLGIRQLKRF